MKKRQAAAFFIAAAMSVSSAKADLRTFHVQEIGSGGAGRATVHVYELGTSYAVRASGVQSEGINLAQAAHTNKTLPFAVSAGSFQGSSPASGLNTVQGSFLSRLAPPASLPTLLCFNPSGFEIRAASSALGKLLPVVASSCMAAIQSPALLIKGGVAPNRSKTSVAWRHSLVAKSGVGDRVIIVEGMLSPLGLSEFLAGKARRCTSTVGTVTRQRALIKIAPNGLATASCSLGLADVAILNVGRSTGAVHYGNLLSGEASVSPPVAVLFDD